MDRSIALAVALLAACCALAAVDADCDEWSFKCGNGECVSVDRRCDGVAHCSDGSDEAEATCRIDAAPLSLYDRAEVTVAFNEDFVGLWVMLCGDAACSKVYVDGTNEEGVLSYAAEVNCNTRGYNCNIESSGSPDDMDEFQTAEIVLVVERGPGRLSVWLKDHADHPRTVSISDAYSQLSLRPEVWIDYMPADIVVVSSLTEAPTTVTEAATTEQPATTVTEAASTVTEAATTVTEAATTVTEAATTEQPATTVTEAATTVTEAATTVTEAATTVTEAATTEQPATTVTEAATTVTEATTTVTEAATTVTEAATTTTEAATTEQPATAVTEATTTEQPATTVTEAATTITEATTTQQPATTVTDAATTTTEAATTEQPATTITEAASTVTEATVSDEPSTTATASASSTAAPWPPLPVPAACTDDMLSLMIPVAGDCNKYVICYSGRSQQMACPSVLYFNYQLQTCDWPRNVVCSP